MNNKITEKQKRFIEAICNELDVEFSGNTKEEASNFISRYIDEFKREQAMQESLNQIMYEDY